MIISNKNSNHIFINCPKIYDDITKDIDITEHKVFYIFYSCEDRNTLSYIKSMGKLTKYNIELKIINIKDTSTRDFIKLTNEINGEDLKYIILKPMEDKLVNKLRFALNDNEVDKDGKLTIDAVCHILKSYKIEPQPFLMIGRHLGKQIALRLLEMDYTPIIGHSKTKELKDMMKWCKLIISTAGSKDLVKKDLIQDGAIIIDVGLGDLEEAAYNKCYFTPRVNGVGLVTTAMLVKEIRG